MYEANFEFNTNTIEFDSEINTKDIQANLILNVTAGVDTALSTTSKNPVQNKVITNALDGKQETLVSGTNIKTVNNTSLLGSGNISVATSAQGALADSAIQPNDNITELNNNAGYITSSDVGNGVLTIKRNSATVGSFSANQISATTVNITVPTSATDVGAVPTSRTINGKVLSSDITLSASDVGALPDSTTIGDGQIIFQKNGTGIGTITANQTTSTTVNFTIPTTASDVGAVPTSRTINGKALTSNITITAADTGALPDSTTIGSANLTIQRNGTGIGTFSANATSATTVNISVPTTATEVGALPSTTTINDLTSTAQQSALNSGVTTSIVTQVGTNATAITTINSLIPSSTTASNPLTNEAFVNSSIATNTAYFIGTFNSVAELEAYSGTLTNNDYAFVATTDTAGNTLYDRYKYNANTETWVFEYELNNSSFTAVQWAAINSGANEQNISAIASNTSAITGLQNSKQDKLTAGANVQINGTTISATNTTYTNGTGLNLSNTTFSVDFTEVATASQGCKADTALQPNDNITQLTNNAGYQANVIETIKVNGTSQTITSKTVDITVPTNNNQLTNGAGYITSSALTPYALSANLSTVATTGSYNDLSNKPTIPAAVTESTVSSWGFTKNVGTVTSVNNVSPVNGNVTLSIPPETTETTVSGWGFTKNVGTVTSVNNVSPVNGNVSITIPTVPTIATTVNASSTNAETVGAKLFYDTVGNIESALNTINSGS